MNWATERHNLIFIYFNFLLFEMNKNDKKRETRNLGCGFSRFQNLILMLRNDYKSSWGNFHLTKKLFFTYTNISYMSLATTWNNNFNWMMTMTVMFLLLSSEDVCSLLFLPSSLHSNLRLLHYEFHFRRHNIFWWENFENRMQALFFFWINVA